MKQQMAAAHQKKTKTDDDEVPDIYELILLIG
jgi:hypothetical protein